MLIPGKSEGRILLPHGANFLDTLLTLGPGWEHDPPMQRL